MTNCISLLCPLGDTTAIEDGVEAKAMPWTTVNQPLAQKAVQQPSQTFQLPSIVLIFSSQQQHLSTDKCCSENLLQKFFDEYCQDCEWENQCSQVTGELDAMVSRVEA